VHWESRSLPEWLFRALWRSRGTVGPFDHFELSGGTGAGLGSHFKCSGRTGVGPIGYFERQVTLVKETAEFSSKQQAAARAAMSNALAAPEVS
jgi:hypothetical protein